MIFLDLPFQQQMIVLAVIMASIASFFFYRLVKENP
jgi:hypothetical protein